MPANATEVVRNDHVAWNMWKKEKATRSWCEWLMVCTGLS